MKKMSKPHVPQNSKDSAPSEGKKMDRRTFLRAGLAAGIMAGAGMIAGCSIPFIGKSGNVTEEETAANPSSSPEAAEPAMSEQSPQATQMPVSAAYPFKLGVASGDPLPDGIVLWTRLVPNIRVANGGMPIQPATVKWEMAKDDKFQKIVKSGTETAIPELAHSVHVEVDGLEPATTYYYRFTAGSDVSPVGRTKTAPAFGAKLDRFNFAFASCQAYGNGYYTAYDHMIKENIDLVVFLGDYIYEGGTPKDVVKGREHNPNRAVTTLADYRLRYSQYKADPSLQAAHAAFPWIVTFDDHEVRNNWGGAGFPNNPKHPSLMQWRTAAFQAYYEHMPLRKTALPSGPDMLLYRRLKFGDLAEFSVLDTRQYRAGFPCQAETTANCDELYKYSMFGDAQEKWLLDGLAAS
ncbi:MAG: Alkaline phosphatase [Paenibacillaceae bacterium]|nr:Alkaline phosphatase [Paenibacillaceae bacterium]